MVFGHQILVSIENSKPMSAKYSIGQIALLFICSTGLLWAQHDISFLNIPPRQLHTEARSSDYEQLTHQFELQKGLIVVEGRLNGQAGKYILDTGAPCLVVNAAQTTVAQQSATTGQGLSESVSLTTGQARLFEFAGRSRRQLSLLALDMQHLKQAEGPAVAGLIGAELFSDAELYLDYEEQLFALLPARKNMLHQLQTARIELDIEFEGHLPVLRMTIGSKVLRFGIDSGAGSNLIDKEALAQLPADWVALLQQETVRGLDKVEQSAERLRLTQLQLSPDGPPMDMTFLQIDFAPLRAQTGYQIDGLLGYDFLSQFRLSINYPARKLYIW